MTHKNKIQSILFLCWTTKISIITDDFNVQSKELRSFDIKGVALATPVPLNVHICNSNVHDALIINNQLDQLYNTLPAFGLFNNNNILIADAAYDSNVLRTKMENLKLGKLLTGTNLRNNIF